MGKTRRTAYDLDGTLVSTREANRLAYESVGVIPPSDFHVRSWRTWATEEQHRRKNQALPRYLKKHVEHLPGMVLWKMFPGPIISTISEGALDALSRYLPSGMEIVRVRYPEEKVEILEHSPEWGVYFDDSRYTVDLVNRRCRRWRGIHTSSMSFLLREKAVDFALTASWTRH